MKTTKSLLRWLSMMSAILLLFAGVTACGGNDDDDGGGSGGSSRKIDSRFVGTWSGQDTYDSGNRAMVLRLRSNGSAEIKLFTVTRSGVQYILNETNCTWYYRTSDNDIFVKYNDTNGYPLVVKSVTSNSLTVGIGINNSEVVFYLNRSSDDSGSSSGGDDSGSSHGWNCKYCHDSHKCHNYTNTSSGSDKYYCGGSGDCYKCDGKGYYRDVYTGNKDVKCTVCRGSGNCQECGGNGRCHYCS